MCYVKNFQNYCHINLDAIAHNVQCLKKIIKNDIKIMGVVKADGYGHGAVEVSKVLIKNGIEYLAVATLEEALELRAQFKIPILLLGYIPNECINLAIKNDITLTIYCVELAKEVSKYARKLGLKALVHIKIDTGMNRIGINYNNLEDIQEVIQMPNLEMEGIYTHFSSADIDEDYTNIQFERFIKVCDIICEQKDIKYKHCCNSCAIINYPNMHLNMVRPGIILYGLNPTDKPLKNNLKLKPVMSIKSRIIHINKVQKDSKVSYGGTYITRKVSNIATIPIGYADGYGRGLSNNINVIVNGKLAPVVGNICMNQCMINISDIENVKLFDEVMIMGSQGLEEISANEIANKMNTINYEIITSFGKRASRIYV